MVKPFPTVLIDQPDRLAQNLLAVQGPSAHVQ